MNPVSRGKTLVYQELLQFCLDWHFAKETQLWSTLTVFVSDSIFLHGRQFLTQKKHTEHGVRVPPPNCWLDNLPSVPAFSCEQTLPYGLKADSQRITNLSIPHNLLDHPTVNCKPQVTMTEVNCKTPVRWERKGFKFSKDFAVNSDSRSW